MIDKAKNSLQRLTGRSKRTAGRVSGDRKLEARGAAEKIGGDVKQAGENLKHDPLTGSATIRSGAGAGTRRPA